MVGRDSCRHGNDSDGARFPSARRRPQRSSRSTHRDRDRRRWYDAQVLTSDFSFDLPEELIAQHPAPRGASRMMVLAADEPPLHARFSDLPAHLEAGDLLVVNDTRVIPARLFGALADTGGRLELLLVEKQEASSWICLIKPGRKARVGRQIAISEDLRATVIEKQADGRHLLRFSKEVEPCLERLGSVPLPPYIKRPPGPEDATDYQTIFASHPGAIAAPTAGLHFTDKIRTALLDRGVEIRAVTLHVGIGTFKPVTTSLVHEHQMDSERYAIPEPTARAIAETRRRGGRVVAVGTTVARTLEGAAAERGLPLGAASGATSIFIRPGYTFQVIDALLTNFHLPRSTLLMLVSALAGRERILDAYREAVRQRYRFFSYGDAMFLAPNPT